MKVLHIANTDKGGAANAMLALHFSLINSGVVSKVLVLHKYKNDNSIYAFLKNRSGFQKLKDSIAYRLFSMKRRYNKWLFRTDSAFTYFDGPYDLTIHPLYERADIIHLHWYHNFIDLPKLLCSSSKPIVLTLHDENIFLGGFHYSFDKNAAHNRSRVLDMRFAHRKQYYLRNSKDLHLVAPSKWLYGLLVKNNYSSIHYIPYAIDKLKFKPLDKILAREQLGIETHHDLYLILADHLESKRKGIEDSIEAFTKYSAVSSRLMVVGSCDKKISHPRVQYWGYLKDYNALSAMYSAADATVVSTLADNLPNTVLESLACGTPVIGFDVGGMKDMIDCDNGLLLRPGSFRAIFNPKTICNLKELDKNLISQKCQKKFSINKQSNSYKLIYQSLYLEDINIADSPALL